MDKKTFFQSRSKSVFAENENYFLNVNLENNTELFLENDVRRIINLDEQTTKERNESLLYRPITKINFLSILDGYSKNDIENTNIELKEMLNGSSLTFNENTNTLNKTEDTLLELFDIYVCYPKYTSIGNNQYNVELIPIISNNQLSIHKCGFDKNIFFDTTYLMKTKRNIVLNNIIDEVFNLPIMDLYLYFDLKINSQFNLEDLTTNQEQLGDKLLNGNFNGGVIEFNRDTFEFNLIKEPKVIFNTNVIKQNINGSTELKTIKFFYKPYHKIKIREFSSYIEQGNQNTIAPEYAINSNNNTVIWRDVLDNGFIEPDTGLGVDFPFVNNTHYVYENINFLIKPQMSDFETNELFTYLKIGFNQVVNKANNDDLLKEVTCV